jgi:tetratricopeptide (TPR) repeat protein
MLYDRQGKYAEAIANYTRALAIRKAQLGEENPDTAVTMARLGEAHLEHRDFARAAELLERAIALAEATSPSSPELPEYRQLLARAKRRRR